MARDIAGIILAAGRSTRMGRPKLNLAIGAESFYARSARSLQAAGCVPILAVVNAEDASAEPVAGVDVIVNPAPHSEQIDSLRLAIARLADDVAGALIMPVDLPLILPDTVRAVAQAFREQPALIVAPFYTGVAGHPILLARELFAELLQHRWEEGVRSVIMAHAADVREVRVPDPGILIDIDTPADYRHYIEQT